MYNGNGFKMVACDFYCEHGWPPNTNFGTRKWWTRKYATPLLNMICFFVSFTITAKLWRERTRPNAAFIFMKCDPFYYSSKNVTSHPIWKSILRMVEYNKGGMCFRVNSFYFGRGSFFADVRSSLAHFCFFIVCYFWSWCLRCVDICVCLCVRCTSLSVCLWLALRDGVLSCTRCWLLMVVGLFIFESVSNPSLCTIRSTAVRRGTQSVQYKYKYREWIVLHCRLCCPTLGSVALWSQYYKYRELETPGFNNLQA